MKKSQAQLQPAHIGLATIATAAMALALCFGLKLIGLIGRLDGLLLEFFLPKGMKLPIVSLHPVILWVATAVLVFFLPAIIFRISESWRRYLIWGITLALTIFWAPVLILSSYKPEISTAIVAVLWSGFCAMFYTHNHRLPVDEFRENPKKPANAAS